ncbi:MAG: hypothetical protein HC780_08960 [Leptolyngbyaceae cyanobacterium CSU_1_3]|nr:hypothetical protein [Leptolyngbyaceae cyanobacterium CSU_1_3]
MPIAANLSVVLQQQIPTSLMVVSSQVSAVAVLIPMATRAAGALNIAQSD